MSRFHFRKIFFLLLFIGFLLSHPSTARDFFDWKALPELPPMGGQETGIGVAGAFVGIHNDMLIVAGGANFDRPFWDHEKAWHDDIWVLPLSDSESSEWIHAGSLSRKIAYGTSVNTPHGILCMGGADGHQAYAEVFFLKWDAAQQTVLIEKLPSLPGPCTNTAAALIGEQVYLAGGSESVDLGGAMDNFWRLDLSAYEPGGLSWEVLPAWPGPVRAYNITIAQHNGYTDCIYVMSGRRSAEVEGEWIVMPDVYEFNPDHFASADFDPWRQRTDMPMPRMAGAAAAVGQSHVFLLAGADGTLYKQQEELRDQHPGFPKEILGYHTITDTWFNAGSMPQNQVTTPVIEWDGSFVVASGEIKPRTRSPQVWLATPVQQKPEFGWINSTTIIIYLLMLVGMGFFFSRRNKNTEDFFRGGQRIPWWAAGCSIFATMLSSLTFMSVPAKTFATDWLYFFINMSIVALAPFIIYFVLPFFRRIDATSAYQYIEMRFNLASRLFVSASYILFQTGRMAIVMYLPALALATVTPFSIETCILAMGLLSILYCTLGGVEAVIWTDTLQTFVLLGGALLSFLVVMFSLDGGIGTFLATASLDKKLTMVDWSWDITTASIFVIVVGGLAQTLIPYSSDQGVVQRYMSVSSEKKAAQSIWTNAWLSLFGTILFFSMGTALYVFYKHNPTELDPTFQTDAVFPLFISRQLPVGVAGIVIAGIFAAAQSTISTSMNSMSTAFITDFIRRFNVYRQEGSYFRLARVMTIIFGLTGTGVALLIVYADIKSLWDSFLGILGLFGGAICGLFMLGMFTRRANGQGALIGAVCGAAVLWTVQQTTDVSFLLYGAIGVLASIGIGFLASLAFPANPEKRKGLTIYDLKTRQS